MNPLPKLLRKLFNAGRLSVRWIGGVEPAVLLTLILSAFTLWAFFALAGEVLEGDTQAIDDWCILNSRHSDALEQPIGPVWLPELARDATALGGIGWLMVATTSVAGFLALDRKPHMATFLIGSTLSGLFASLLLKSWYERPRPALVPHLDQIYTSSFPSGHSMLSAVVYLTLGSLIAAVVKRPLLKVYVMALAVMITTIVGVSRVYLGVHYPTDVIAGWIAGLFWALACSLVARNLQLRGQVETETSN